MAHANFTFFYTEIYTGFFYLCIMEQGWNEVFMTAHEYKAEMAKEILENEGIKVVVLNQKDTAYQSFGEIYLYVSEENTERAVELLKNLKH
jgi:hypothetical protein